MAEQALDTIRRPRSDGRAVDGIVRDIFGYMALPIAHSRGVFRLLGGKRLTLPEICDALELQPRPAAALLAAVTSLGLLELSDGRYALTAEAKEYLLPSSPAYYGSVIDLTVASGALSYAAIDRAISTGSPQTPETDFASFEEQTEFARAFTRAMHSMSVPPSLGWPELVDLGGELVLLDVGGGSGAHSIGACLHWPQLRAVVLDLPPVCDVAEELVVAQALEGRISTQRADMWEDPFPSADVHFYSNILHDWPPEKGRFLLEKSFESLEPGGRIVLHESLFDDDKTGPFTVAAYSMVMAILAEGQQYSGRELTEMLTAAGFQDVLITAAFHPYSILEAKKQ